MTDKTDKGNAIPFPPFPGLKVVSDNDNDSKSDSKESDGELNKDKIRTKWIRERFENFRAALVSLDEYFSKTESMLGNDGVLSEQLRGDALYILKDARVKCFERFIFEWSDHSVDDFIVTHSDIKGVPHMSAKMDK